MTMARREEQLAFYDARLDQHGISPAGAGWNASGETQQVRARVLAEMVAGRGCEDVLDVGCGIGALVPHLAPLCYYTGIDINPRMVAAARVAHPIQRFVVADICSAEYPGENDAVVASGLFGLGFDFEVVRAMWQRARVMVAFNAPSLWAGAKDHRVDPLEVLKQCRELTPKLVLRADYLVNDATFALYR